jgi:hypothetical protein
VSKGCVVCIIVTVNTIGSIGALPVIIILVPYTWNNHSKIYITLLTKNQYYIIHIYAYCTNTAILIHTHINTRYNIDHTSIK